MITITLLNPPLTLPITARRPVIPPLGLLSIASFLRQNPVNKVSIFDAVAEGPAHETRSIAGFVTVGLSLDEIQMRLATERPSVVGISFISSDQARNAHQVCDRVKQLKRDKDIDITTVAGGPHVTAFPQDVMADLNIDYAVVGEGEIPMFKLCESLTQFKEPQGIPGVCWRDRTGEIHFNDTAELVPDLDLLPAPARDLLTMQRYSFADTYYGMTLKPHATMELYRGCPHQCVYCQVPRMFGKEFRKRSPEHILEEIRMLKKTYNIREVQFVGDNLFGDRRWAMQWMTELIESGNDVHWSTMSGQSLYNLDAELAQLAIESGMRSIVLDFPSADEDAYDSAYERPGSLDNVRSLITSLRRARVYVGGLFSIGAPGETRRKMRHTVNFALGLPLNEVHFRPMTPFPGTPLWDSCASRNLFDVVPSSDDLLRDGGYVKTALFSPRDVEKIQHMGNTRVATRAFLSSPDKIVGGAVGWVKLFVLHPVDFVSRIFRYLGSYVGISGPRRAFRRRSRATSKRITASRRRNTSVSEEF